MKNKNEILVRGLFTIIFTVFLTMMTQAQATRTWVSGVGDDVNPCSRTAPCKTFAGAISKTATGGEINALDPGGYGAVTITKSITLNGENTLASILVAGTNGIVISDSGANNITVTLRGLEFEGLSLTGNSPGLNGIRILSARKVNIENCVIRNFSQNGISDERIAGGSLFVSNSDIRNNTLANVSISGAGSSPVNATLDNVKFVGSTGGSGLIVNGGNTALVRKSVFFDNSMNGILVNDSGTDVSVEDSVFNNNDIAIRIQLGPGIVRISGNNITKNRLGLRAGSAGGQIISYGNNKISGNSIDGLATSNIMQQ